MQKKFTLTGFITVLVVAAAGILLTAQMARVPNLGELAVPLWILWAGELAGFCAALFIWAPAISLPYLIASLAGLFLLRYAIGATAASLSSMVQTEQAFDVLLGVCSNSLLPRASSILFSVLAFYPLRILLPQQKTTDRTAAVTKTANSHDSALSEDQVTMISSSANAQKSGTFLFGVQPNQTDSTTRASLTFEKNIDINAALLPEHLKDIQITIRLDAIAAQLPPAIVKQSILDRMTEDSLEFSIPLYYVVPQMKEALLYIKITDFMEYLPNGWAESPIPPTEEKILLPLDVVVAQVPAEIFQLPAPNPPAWAALAQEEERILFACV